MAYTIVKSDKTVLLSLADSSIDNFSTSLTLVGKNASSYGQSLNNSLVFLLENFATDGRPPRNPLVGQLWYDKSSGRLQVYTADNIFKAVGVATVSNIQPSLSKPGDFWIDENDRQLYFTADGQSYTLVGPQFSSSPSAKNSGWINENVVDNTGQTRTIASLYNNNTLVAVASSSTIVFGNVYQGMMSVNPGINLNTSIPNIRFVGTATGFDFVNTFTNTFLQISPGAEQYTDQRLNIANDQGLTVGTNQDILLYTAGPNRSYLASRNINKTLDISAATSLAPGIFTAIRIDPKDPTQLKPNISFFPDLAIGNATANFNSDVTITGNLTVIGSATQVRTADLTVKDKNISLATDQTTPSDTFANGGGITLIGSRDHTVLWQQSIPVSSTSSWVVNDNFNIDHADGGLYINGSKVLDSRSLSSTVVSAPGLTVIGNLTSATIGNIVVTETTIQATGTNASLVLNSAGIGNISVSNRRITDLDIPSSSTDAANKQYVDTQISLSSARSSAITIDTTGMIDPSTDIIDYLNKLFPVTNSPEQSSFDLPNGTRVRALCVEYTTNIPSQPVNFSSNTTLVDKDGFQSSETVLTAIAISPQTAFNVVPVPNYTVREYVVTNQEWTFTGLIN